MLVCLNPLLQAIPRSYFDPHQLQSPHREMAIFGDQSSPHDWCCLPLQVVKINPPCESGRVKNLGIYSEHMVMFMIHQWIWGCFFLCTPFWTNFHIVGCFYHILPCSILIIPIDYGSPIQYLVGGIPTPLQKYEWVTVGMMKFPKNMGKSFKIPWFQSPPTRISSMSSLIPRQRPPNPRIALPRIRKRQASERIPVRSEAPWAQSGMILFWYCKMI